VVGGDWVAVRVDASGSATIGECLPRRGLLVRKQAGPSSDPQPLAAEFGRCVLEERVRYAVIEHDISAPIEDQCGIRFVCVQHPP